MAFIVPPSRWEIQHAGPIMAAQAYQAANNNQLPDTRAWRMLEYRYDINPSRFTFFHPNVGRMIELERTPPPPAEQIVDGWEGQPPPIIPPVDGGTPVIPPLNPPIGQEIDPPGNPPPQVVPEPGSLLMLAVAILTIGLLFRSQKGRRLAC